MSVLGKRLRKSRKNKGLTQNDVAKEIDATYQTISNYERGTRDPDTETLSKLAQLYETSTDYLVGNSDDPSLKQISNSEILKEIEEAKKAMNEAAERYYKILEKHSLKQENSPN